MISNQGHEEPVPSIFDEDPEPQREQRRRELRRIRSVLVTSGILIVLPAMIGGFRQSGGSVWSWVFVGGILALYFVFGALAMRWPLTAILCGLGFYIVLQAVIVWQTPPALYHGWIFRLLVLLNLLMPIQRAKALQD